MKYAIVVDSSCGLTKEEAKKLGWYYLPLHIVIDGKEYEDGIDITGENLFNYYTTKVDAKTSAVNFGEAEELFDKLSKEYDQVFVYTISKYLSGTCQSLTVLAKNYPNIRVIQSKQIVHLISLDLLWLQNQIAKDESKINEYIDWIENEGFRRSITLIPKHNKYLVKGGRLHPTAAIVARMLSIVPLIAFADGQLTKEGIGRVYKKAVVKNIESKGQFKKANPDNELITCYLHSGANDEEKELFTQTFIDTFGEKPFIKYIAPVVAIHTGPESYVGIVLELDKETKETFSKYLDSIKY
ncbi:DegV family protein [Mycoplasmopsis iners]|uniref:DegV family protein n=1 Tax=Mycoplasmopsis iners TaxID=76630 RepID=UPI0004984DD6|nr:DegV family protein [Mycoplasmopsis iners]